MICWPFPLHRSHHEPLTLLRPASPNAAQAGGRIYLTSRDVPRLRLSAASPSSRREAAFWRRLGLAKMLTLCPPEQDHDHQRPCNPKLWNVQLGGFI
jgi:hypothetical protein